MGSKDEMNGFREGAGDVRRSEAKFRNVGFVFKRGDGETGITALKTTSSVEGYGGGEVFNVLESQNVQRLCVSGRDDNGWGEDGEQEVVVIGEVRD